jgi:Family of unknown function (DUF5995)
VFSYDAQLAAAAGTPPESIPGVLQLLHLIDNTCIDGDGLKWFNRLYLDVTQAVADRVATCNFLNTDLLADLDIRFASFYFKALSAALTGGSCPGCWTAVFECRNQTSLARIQFALAGMNAHINHDLPLAVVLTSRNANTPPQHGTPQYIDYTSINSNLDGLIETAKKVLDVRLLGDSLPPATFLEDLIAGWNLAAAREKAWINAEGLWNDGSLVTALRMDVIDGLTTVISKSLLIPVP